MGRTYKWFCKQCGYEVSMSGGCDRGFFSITETFHCKKCKKLMDLGTAKFVNGKQSNLFNEDALENHNKNSFFSLFKKKKQRKTPQIEKIELSPQCSYCHGEVELWNTNTKPCPCCGDTMIKHVLDSFWD